MARLSLATISCSVIKAVGSKGRMARQAIVLRQGAIRTIILARGT